jgi:hypothetical protein
MSKDLVIGYLVIGIPLGLAVACVAMAILG